MKNRKRILAAVLTAIMTISMLPASTLASEPAENEAVESAEEAVSMPEEEQEVEAPAEDISEEKAEEADAVSSDTVQTEETADPAVEETEEVTEAVDTAVQEEAEEAITDAAAEDITDPAETAGEEAAAEDTVEWPITLQAKGTDYIVTVTFDENAGLPADARISVEEILANDKAYDGYVEQAADKIDADVENLSYVRLFDISLVGADGGKLEPTGPVDVKIRLKDVEKADETTQVVHFAGEKEIPEIIDTEIKGKDVSFETDGFSIYAVVADGDHSNEARLKVTFDLNGSSISGSTNNIIIYVKPDDITDNGGNEFNKIVYDPGMPEAANKKFMGWTTEQNYTDEITPMTIDAVREDVKTRLRDSNFKEGDQVTYYAMMFNAFELYYKNETNVLFNTVSFLSTADFVTAEIKQEYTVQTSTGGFLGWVEDGTVGPVYNVGDQITLSSPETVLGPKIGPGKWLFFDGNDGGSTAADTASYTPPAFIPEGITASEYEPKDPHRLGYDFGGWYTAADGGSKFNFDQMVTEDTTIYAHWIPAAEATYTVIIWAQSVGDDKDAADKDKTYDYVESHTLTAETGTKITEETISDYLGYGNSNFGVTDLANNSTAFWYRTFNVENGVGSNKDEVNPLGNTVVNVYYDRELMTIQFRGATQGQQETWYELDTDGIVEEAYGLINGEYVRLTTTITNKRIEWSKVGGALALPDNITQIKYSTKNNGTWVYSDQTANVSTLRAKNAGDYLINLPVGSSDDQAYVASGNKYLYSFNSAESGSYCRLKWTIAGDTVYTYNGATYDGPIYEKETGNVLRYTGLYGQQLSKYGYGWPDPDSTWWSISYLGSFSGNLFGDPTLDDDTQNQQGIANTIKTYKTNSTPNTRMIFYVQDAENESTYTRVADAGYRIPDGDGFNITERFLGAEPVSYAWSNSEAVPTSGWVNASGGFTSEREGSYLHIRYDRVKKNLVFVLGNEQVKTISDIPYGKSLSSYQSEAPVAPPVGENEYFYGWFEDPEGEKKVDWNGTMPLGNMVVYGITAPVQYHVIIDMNAKTGETVTFPDPTQKLEFWLDYGETISGANLMQAIKTGSGDSTYSIIGFYTENAEAGQFDNDNLWNFEARITEDSLAVKYTGPDDPAREEYDDDGWDSTVGVFKLYASWRDDTLIKSGGIHIRYVSGETTYNDRYGYADMASVIVRPEPEKTIWPEGQRFAGWKLGDGVYLPGQTFSAAKDAADLEDEKYYITLTAEYVNIEEKTPTHIVWYRNDGSEGEAAIHHRSEELDINQATEVPAAPTRTGYKFLGWAKDTERANEGDQPNYSTNKTESDFLDYNEGTYYLHGTTDKVVTQVAADEVLPYEALYAIWAPLCQVYHSATGKTESVEITKGGEIDLVAKVTDDYLYGGYYEYVEDGDHKGDPYTEVSGRHVVPYKDTDTSFEGVTYFLKEVKDDYLKPQVFLVYNTTHGGLIQGLYGFVDVDSNTEYTTCGLSVGGTDYPFEMNSLAGQFEITRGGDSYKTLDKDYLFKSLEEKDPCYIGLATLTNLVTANTALQIKGYYVTPDGIKVYGHKDRYIKFAEGVKAYGGKPVFTGWSPKGNTVAGIVMSDTEPETAKKVSSAPMMFTRKLTISAPSDKIEYTITKVYDSGTEEQIVEGGDYTGEITYETRDGYMFAGWYLNEEFTTPADFTDVNSDMTVYAKYVSCKDVSVSFSLKSKKSGIITFQATVSVKGQDALQNVSLTAKDGNPAILGSRSVKKSGRGKTLSYTTQYKGTVDIKGLSLIDKFTSVVSWATPDGTIVTGPELKCRYILGTVSVQ